MKFYDLDKKMRVFETSPDLCVLPGMFMVAHLDGRSFTRLTKEVCQFEAPFVGQLFGRLPDVLYWTVGGSLALATAACSFRATVKPQTTKEHVQSSTQRLKGPAARYTIATVSSVFHFVGVLYLVGYAPVGFPALQQINRWMFFAVAFAGESR